MPVASIHSALASIADALINWLHDGGLAWGAAIIGATFVVRLIVSPFAYRQIRTMSVFRSMAEDVKGIRDYYGDDIAGITGAMERLYKENKFHPLNFVLPALLQAPFFASVFFYLNSRDFKVDVGDDRSFLFVDDLTRATSSDSVTFLGLVGLYLGVQILILLFQNKFKPDKKTLMIGIGIPALITIFLVHFPAALMLYWTAGMVGLLLQQVLMKFLTREPEIAHWQRPEGDHVPTTAPQEQNAFAKMLADAQATKLAESAKKDDTVADADNDATAPSQTTEAESTTNVQPTQSKARKTGKKKRPHGRR